MIARADAAAKTKPEKSGHLYLVDGSGYIFRAYHALPPLSRKSDGLPTGAVAGFCAMLHRLLKETRQGDKPTHLAVVFDTARKTFRNDIYADYKANRPPPPDDLIPQFPLVREATKAFSAHAVEMEGFEADDLIATYARQAAARGMRVTIVSSDKDLMQLVEDGAVEMMDPVRQKRIGSAAVMEKFGVRPELVTDAQALIGDSTDNVPGVPGVGPKAAATLINEIGPVETILSGDAEAHEKKLARKLGALQEELDRLAGEAVKINSAAQIAAVLAKKYKIATLPKDKKGNLSAGTETIEALAAAGNVFCQKLLRARNISRAMGDAIRKVLADPKRVRTSLKLVRLRDDAKLPVSLEELAVEEFDAKKLIAFLKALEFNALTRRVAEEFDADAEAVTPAKLKIAYDGAAHAEETQAAEVKAPEGGKPGAIVNEAALKAPIDVAKYETVRDLRTLERWIARAYEAGQVTVDTETNSLDAMQAKLVGVALAIGPQDACYIPLAHAQGEGLALSGAAEIEQIAPEAALARLKPLLEDEGVLKIGQNVKYDYVVLANCGISMRPFDDTMLISYALDAGRQSHGMDELAKTHLGHTPIPFKDVAGSGKSAVTFDLVPVDKATRYSAEDADVTLRLHGLLKPKLAERSLCEVYETLERPLVGVLAGMEMAGIRIDKTALAKLSLRFAEKMTALEEAIHRLAGTKFNPGSPKQLGEILFERLKLPAPRTTRTGAYATDAEVLEELALQGHELPRLLLDWRLLQKLKGTYTDALPSYINPRTGRVHTSFALASTSTGRLASSEPNLQNIPIRTEEGREIRRAFVASEGMTLISADYSQIELRLLAHVADIPSLKRAFAEGTDIHALTASEMFGVPVKGMPPEVRRRAKAINFGIIYGISAFGLANQLGIPRGEADAYIKRYFERFPGIRDYMESTKETCRKQGYVETIFGRRAHFPKINDPNPSVRGFNERAAINAPLQGSAADIIRRAMIRMPDALARRKLSAKMLLQVHDELVFEAPAAETEETCAAVREVMENATLPSRVLTVPLTVEAKSGRNWDEAH